MIRLGCLLPFLVLAACGSPRGVGFDQSTGATPPYDEDAIYEEIRAQRGLPPLEDDSAG